MKIVKTYSHLNGLEYLLVHRKHLWEEIQTVIDHVDADRCKTKVSLEKRMAGQMKYSPKDMNQEFHERFRSYEWSESRVSYWVTDDERLIRQTISLDAPSRKVFICCI
jgi:gamma-glutamyl phosphate reductase